MTDGIKGPPPIPGLESKKLTVGGVRLHYWIGGDPNAPPVVLWHGFLGTGYSWRHVAEALTDAGCSVLVPDMRGYGDSDKPEGNEGYDARSLAEEFRTLVAGIGFGKGAPLIIAAHDMGAPPALIWAADHPAEVAALLYVDEPTMLGEVLRPLLAYEPVAMAHGSLWWWILPLAPGVPEALLVGNERAFLEWMYLGGATARPEVFTDTVIDEYVRTFSGRTGVLGAMGVYRAAFETIAQTERLVGHPPAAPITAVGGEGGLGGNVATWLRHVVPNAGSVVIADCGHFVPEEAPEALARLILSHIDAGPAR